jgi:hypothetical protein
MRRPRPSAQGPPRDTQPPYRAPAAPAAVSHPSLRLPLCLPTPNGRQGPPAALRACACTETTSPPSPPHTPAPPRPCLTAQGLKARLPPSARALYYKDLIGNVSSSNTRRSLKEVGRVCCVCMCVCWGSGVFACAYVCVCPRACCQTLLRSGPLYAPTAREHACQTASPVVRLPSRRHARAPSRPAFTAETSSTPQTHGNAQTAVDISLRYPLMGGWKADFLLGALD